MAAKSAADCLWLAGLSMPGVRPEEFPITDLHMTHTITRTHSCDGRGQRQEFLLSAGRTSCRGTAPMQPGRYFVNALRW